MTTIGSSSVSVTVWPIAEGLAAENIKHAHAISGIDQARQTSQKKDVVLINSAHDYEFVIISKTNFGDIQNPAGIGGGGGLASVARLVKCLRKSRRSVAAARSTELRLPHFSSPEGFRSYQPCRYFQLSLQKCNEWQDKFLMNLRSFTQGLLAKPANVWFRSAPKVEL